MGCPSGQGCHVYCFLPFFAHGSTPCSFCLVTLRSTKQKAQMLPILARLLVTSPLLQAVAIPQLHSSGNLGMAPVAPLADGSRLKKQIVRNALHPFCFFESVHQASVNSLFHRSYQLAVIEI